MILKKAWKPKKMLKLKPVHPAKMKGTITNKQAKGGILKRPRYIKH